MVRGVVQDVEDFVGEEPQSDDITVLALKFKGTNDYD
jgi:serine phosphatase RsbU (regulator of sigma subunit)